ncbi:hypothetical protein AB0758_48560, partial [Tolypothrix bouteillei VB521301_2]|uniref:hypothetical protein n=1 Tax=Tolypothrix bouteillei TaxID=1246981 RepID=UPI0038B4A0C8
TTVSVTSLARANQEIRSDKLVEENWSNIIESQNQLSRQLSEMLRLSATGSDRNLVEQFTDEFNQLAEHFDEAFDTLIALLNSKQPSPNFYFFFCKQDLSAITNKLK